MILLNTSKSKRGTEYICEIMCLCVYTLINEYMHSNKPVTLTFQEQERGEGYLQ